MNRSEKPAPTWSARMVESSLRLCVDFPRLTIGVIIPDVLSLVTTDTMRKSGDTLEIRKLLERPPQTQEDARQLKDTLLGNPLFREKLISQDGRRVAFYIPIERKEIAARVTREIQALVDQAPGITAKIAGLPMAEMGFGEQMFLLMGV